MKSRHLAALFALILLSTSLASCGLFRKKNRCNTCPTWHDQVELNEAQPEPGS